MRNNGVVPLFVALAITVARAWAQTAPAASPAATATDKPASIDGVVTHSTTGEPLPRVHVTLRGNINGTPRQYGAMTAADGKFSITGIVPGSYNVSGERVGFVMPPGPSSRNFAALKADEKKSDYKLALTPTGAIVGRVSDADGEPVESVNVMAEGTNTNESATTDEKGQFRIGGLAPGKYRVKAAPGGPLPLPPEIRTDGTVDVHNAATYYPGVLTAKQAARVEVRPDGDAGGIDIQLTRVPWVRVRGRVTGVSRATDRVFIMARNGVTVNGQSAAAMKPDGSFELWRLDPGKYWISAVWNPPGGQYMKTAAAEIEVAGSNIDNVELRFVPYATIAGRLEFEDDQAKLMPQPPARQGAQQNAPKIQRSLTLREVGTGSMQAAAQAGDDDTFHFEKVPPGRYRVVLMWNTAYVKSMRLGSTVIDGAVVDLTGGLDGAELSVMLSAANGSISGVVQDDKGKAQGTRIVITKDQADPASGARYAFAKADGTYSVANLAPGTYRIVAVAENDSDLVLQPSGLAEYEDLMDSVDVRAGDQVTKDLKRRTPGEK